MNKKISELVSAAGTLAADFLPIVQNGQNKRISIETLFGNVTVPLKVKGKMLFDGTPEVISQGEISVEQTVSHIALINGGLLTLPAGAQGQIKILVVTGGAGMCGLASNSTPLFHQSINFDRIGQTAVLLFTSGRWVSISGTASIINA